MVSTNDFYNDILIMDHCIAQSAEVKICSMQNDENNKNVLDSIMCLPLLFYLDDAISKFIS